MGKHTWRHDARVIMPSSQRCLWVFQYNARTCLRGEKRKGSLPHPAPSRSFHMVSGLETVRRFSVRGCTMLSGSRREQGVKCQGTQSDCPTEYLGVTCSELCILGDSAKGFSWTVQLKCLGIPLGPLSQAEALWESKSQNAGLACQDTRYKGPVYQTVRQNNQSTHDFYHERLPSRATLEADAI